MGNASITVSVINQTPYTWHFKTQDGREIRINAGCLMSYKEDYYSNCNISFRYENHTSDSFSYEFNTSARVYWSQITFILNKAKDGSQIELRCTNDGGTRYCPNYGNIEDEKQRLQEDRRREEPEKREEHEPTVLHAEKTYHLDCILFLSGLMKENPFMFLLEKENDKEKDTDTIVKELREANCPEKVLVLLKEVLRYMESELPKYQSVDLTKEEIADLIRKISSLNLTNPDINILKEVLIGMSTAVKGCSKLTKKDNQKIEGHFPRRTQLASLLLLLLAPLTEDKGCLLEIGRGEGKSCILAMFATILAIRGTKVDIVTSSPLLAQRDQEEWKKFFEMFAVTSSVVPPRYSSKDSPEQQEEHLKDAYRQQIVYGTVGVFAADILKQEFEKRTTRGTRPLVIVDEVDYMTLDSGVQVTFLSHESSGFRHVEQVLSNIWAMISTCQPIEMLETGEIKWATRIQYFHKAVTAAVMGLETSANKILLHGVTLGFYTQEDIEILHQAETKKENDDDGNEDRMSKALSEVMKKLSVSQQYDLVKVFEEVLENSAVFKCYSLENKKAKCFEAREKQGDLNVEMLLLEGGLACEIMSEKSLIDATVSTIKSSIKFSDNLETAKESNNVIVVPVFLKSYIENQLPVFVENALRAVEMSRGREYMIDTSQAAERDIPVIQMKGGNDKWIHKAVALYNQAYITIYLGKGDYKADAMKLLEDAKKSIDVYVSEVSNTMVSCNLSVTGNKDQSTDNNNFQSQMEARMNIFKSWMMYIDNALDKLKELEKSNSDPITEDCSVYMLSEEKDFIITNEMRSLYDYGLRVVFKVKNKPTFCFWVKSKINCCTC